MPDFSARRRVMVDTQVRPSDVTKFPVIDAMLAVPRELYVPDGLREAAYIGDHVPLAPDRVLLDPRTFAKMLDALDFQGNETVLDLACGLGYSAAVIARLAEAVVGVEEIAALAEQADATLAAQGVDNASVIAAPLAEGAARHGPYDVLIIEGGVEALPDALVAQLRPGGRVAALFMDGPLGICRIGLRTPDGLAGPAISWRDAFNATAPVIPSFRRKRSFAL
jgi:protein-L-isoaspartate(D-aspartate) O-methyltransferase